MISSPGFFSLTVNSFTRPNVGESLRPSYTTIFTRPLTTNRRSVLAWCSPQARMRPGKVVVRCTCTTGWASSPQLARATAIFMRHRPDRAENYALDRSDSELALFVDRRLLGNELVATDHIWHFRD